MSVRFESKPTHISAHCGMCKDTQTRENSQQLDENNRVVAAGFPTIHQKKRMCLHALVDDCLFEANECPANILLTGIKKDEDEIKKQNEETQEKIQPQ